MGKQWKRRTLGEVLNATTGHEWKWTDKSAHCIHCGVTFEKAYKPCIVERRPKPRGNRP